MHSEFSNLTQPSALLSLDRSFRPCRLEKSEGKPAIEMLGLSASEGEVAILATAPQRR